MRAVTAVLASLLATACAGVDDVDKGADTDALVDSDSDIDGDTDSDTPEEQVVPAPCPAGTPSAVMTTTGCMIGQVSQGLTTFLGVPYAQPPVGPLRFARTVPVPPWPTPLVASSLGPPCPQTHGTIDGELGPGDGEEDCLTLNVFRPEAATDLPILFFVHGGSHLDGAGSQAVYADDPPLAEDAVVVTLNYRLGALGWLAHPDLSAADPDGVSGNQGLWDVSTALTWVRDNAAALGGDPDRLLVFGESAGGVNACALWLSPGIETRAAAVLTQSAPCSSVNTPLDGLRSDAGLRQGARVAEALGCDAASDVVGCMRAASVQDVLAAVPGRQGILGEGDPYGPVVDGVLVPRGFDAAVAAGTVPAVPLFASVNADEGATFVQGIAVPTEQAYRTAVLPYALLFGVSVDTLVATWSPADHGGDPAAALAALLTDAAFVCPTRRSLLDVQAAGVAPARGLFWERPLFGLTAVGAQHGAELVYVFGTVPLLSPRADRTLSATVRAGWRSMVHDAPAIGDVDPWPTVDAGWAHVTVDADVDQVADVAADRCAVLGL